MRKLLLQLDSSRLPSVFDQVVAYDAGADVDHELRRRHRRRRPRSHPRLHLHPRPQGPAQHRRLDRRQQHVGRRAAPGDGAGRAVRAVLASPSCSTPTARTPPRSPRWSRSRRRSAISRGKKVVILAGTGPVGQRAAGLLATDGAQVTITSRKPEQGDKARQFIGARFNVEVEAVAMNDPSELPELLDGADVLLNSGPAGVQMVPRAAWTAVQDAQGGGGPQRRAAARHRGRRGQRRRRGAERGRGVSARSASATSRPSCTRRASPSCSPGTTWCSTPRRSPTWRGRW